MKKELTDKEKRKLKRDKMLKNKRKKMQDGKIIRK